MSKMNLFLVVMLAYVTHAAKKDFTVLIPDLNVDEENSVENELLGKNKVDTSIAPCKLFPSKFGCCWDGRSKPTGPSGKGCPVCRDRHQYCGDWNEFCFDKVVKKNCPETCQVCKQANICKDHEDWVDFCPMFNSKFCSNPDLNKHCRKTCKMC